LTVRRCGFLLQRILASLKMSLKRIENELEKKFICALKTNRLVALSEQDKENGRFSQVSEAGGRPLEISDNECLFL
jgi:hypothetical protein